MISEERFSALRRQMIEQQLIARGIDDERVLAALDAVPRHEFVPEELQYRAYDDGPLPIGHGQTISQPYVVALMTQTLRLTGSERVLEIGTGSGYQTAILCELAGSVFSLERYPLLADRAASVLSRIGYEHVEIYAGDGSQGLPDMAPYDAIIVTAAAPAVPGPLSWQLCPDEGRMVIPVGSDRQQFLQCVRRCGDQWCMKTILPVRFVRLVGRYGFNEPTDNPPL